MNAHIDQSVPSVLREFANVLGTEVKNWKLIVPEKYGRGYCKGFILNEHIQMLVFNYELNENLMVENPDIDNPKKTLLFKFQNIFLDSKTLHAVESSKTLPSVLLATSSLGTDAQIPVHTNTATINIEVDEHYLKGLFDLSEKSPVLQSLLRNTQPLLFEQMLYPSLQRIVDEIVSESVDETFKLFFLRVKAEELVCNLLMALEKRNTKQLSALNSKDVETIYKIKAQMLKKLNTPPVIKDLAVAANMSPTKLKRLFTQIFGNSIFNYYQGYRMQEAAYLLKDGTRSVADVGYGLGFSNLSHFSKVFAEHTGIKPKLYSRISVKEVF